MSKYKKIISNQLGNFILVMIIGIIGFSLLSLPVGLAAVIDSPKKQMANGVTAEDVICNSGFTLMIKSSSRSAACLKSTTAIKLQDKGWGEILKESSMMDEQREKIIKEKEMTEVPIYNPKINPSDFVSEINNKFFTLVPRTMFIYEGETKEGMEHTEVNVTNNTKVVLGINTIEVWDRVWLDGKLIEETFDWYAQDKSGNVWYFGENSKEYSDGKVTSTKGSWEAGLDGAKPGIIMQAEPKIGEPYRQEYYKDVAEDMAQIIGTDESITVPYGSFTDCLKTKDWNSLVPDSDEHKYYCPDVGGVVLEVVIENGERVALIDVTSNSDSI